MQWQTACFASQAIDTARDNRMPQWLALGERCKGWAAFRLGERDTGLKLLREGIQRWYETGAALHTTHCEIMLAESCLREGALAVARSHLAAARAHRARYSEEYLASEIEGLEALLLKSEQAPSELVEEYLTNSLKTARRQGALSLALRAATSLARLWGEQGRRTIERGV